ncbi:alpha-hydroxy acid oxidase [soil metagenome]
MSSTAKAEAKAAAFTNLQQFAAAARASLSADDWWHLAGGAETETTLRRNRQAIDSLAFRPRVLRGIVDVDISSTFLGRSVRMPVLLAGIGSLRRLHPEAVAPAGAAAARFGIPFGVSSVRREELDSAALVAPDATRFYQLYVDGDDAWLDRIVDDAISAGYGALAVTVDMTAYTRRERSMLLDGLTAHHSDRVFNPFRAGLDWKRIERLRSRYDIPLILKGIATAEDAAIACELGCAGVYVSNHGGRQLDHGLGTLQILPEVVEAVAGRATVIVDGGFHRGADIVKAIALGANAVGLGKAYGFALAAGGEAGVYRLLQLLEGEVRSTLALLGAANWGELKPSHVRAVQPLPVASAWASAFPLLDEPQWWV